MPSSPSIPPSSYPLRRAYLRLPHQLTKAAWPALFRLSAYEVGRESLLDPLLPLVGENAVEVSPGRWRVTLKESSLIARGLPFQLELRISPAAAGTEEAVTEAVLLGIGCQLSGGGEGEGEGASKAAAATEDGGGGSGGGSGGGGGGGGGDDATRRVLALVNEPASKRVVVRSTILLCHPPHPPSSPPLTPPSSTPSPCLSLFQPLALSPQPSALSPRSIDASPSTAHRCSTRRRPPTRALRCVRSCAPSSPSSRRALGC
jgi:hypothetical protein